MNQLSLDTQITNGAIQLGRGNIISSKDIAAKPGDYPIYSSSAQGKGEFGRYADFMFDEELITWSVDGGGRFFFRPRHKFSVTNVCGYMRVDDNIWDRRYVYYALDLQHANMAFDYQMKAHPSVIRKIYTLGEVPKPEQTKIAEILSTVDRAIEQTEALIAKQQRLKTGLMQDLLTRGIDEHGKLRSEQTHKFKDSPLGRIPVEWEVKQCIILCRQIVVGIVIRPVQYYREEGVPMLRSANVKENRIDPGNLVFMSTKDNDKLSKSQVAKGDLVTVRTGYPGTTSVIPPEFDGCNCVDIVISRPDPDQVRSEFLSIWINSDHGKRQVLEGQGGLAQQHFNVGEMKTLLVKTPSLAEQEMIENTLLQQATVMGDLEITMSKLRSIKAALMQDLLTGRRRVTAMLDRKGASA